MAARLAILRAVTLDVGGTWLTVRPSVGHVYAEMAAAWTGRRFEPARLTRQFVHAWRRRPDFDHSRAAWMEIVDETFAGLVSAPPSRTFFGDLYRRFGQPDVWRVDPALPELLGWMRSRGLRVGLISNWDLRLRPLLRALGLHDAFDVIVISAEVGFAKPSPAIYLRAADQWNLNPHEILHVGDELLHDFRGARQAGFRAVWVRPGLAGPTHMAIGSLSQLPDWLRQTGLASRMGT
ncbi:MAG: HAD-IA family hydrolase [Verrucomicrobiota bacterium]|nr:HAD-IA family hydrolase [Limisphaera sp.]MDW8382635.1 HAD-IA family hydrolase [Verrucomicrobiota bacterium]